MSYTCDYSTGGDDIIHRLNDNALTIINNCKIEDKLNVVAVHMNPCHFKRRKFLAEQFRDQMLKTPDVELFIVELAYDSDEFEITDKNNKNHLQLRTSRDNILWSKENLQDIAINKLLPSNWKAVALIDMDIEFDHPNWASDCLKILHGHRDVVSLYNVCLDMDNQKNTMSCFHSIGYQFETKQKYYRSTINFSHTGFAWGYTRKFYDLYMKKLMDFEILGSADYKMALAFFNKDTLSYCDNHKQLLDDFKNRVKYCRLGYVNTLCIHHFHGKKLKEGIQRGIFSL